MDVDVGPRRTSRVPEADQFVCNADDSDDEKMGQDDDNNEYGHGFPPLLIGCSIHYIIIGNFSRTL